MSGVKIDANVINRLTQRIHDLYLSDDIPWIVGYSGGKDSTATLQLVWSAICSLENSRRHKLVYIISTDTLVEQPIVAAWVAKSLAKMQQVALQQDLPIEVHRLCPTIKNTFWVNLIGKGYPVPRQTFRWCTSRLKIDPANRFMLDMVKTYGETILVLGTRRSESISRGIVMDRYAKQRVREWLSPNGNLPNSWVLSPIEDWDSDDVWAYLMLNNNPWGHSNKELLAMYRGASADNECPLVVDASTPSCGNSRFGCWVCTLVNTDKSMQAMVQNDDEKQWMVPLLELRDEIGCFNEVGRIYDYCHRDYRRMIGGIKIKEGTQSAIRGPYTRRRRHELLRKLLRAQTEVVANGPEEISKKLVSDDELREIRRIWVKEKHEFEDALPAIFEIETGLPYPYLDDLSSLPFGSEEWQILEYLARDDYVFLEMLGALLDIEQRTATSTMKVGLLDTLEGIIRKCYYDNEDDAVAFTLRKNTRTVISEQQTIDIAADIEADEEEFFLDEGLEDV